MTASPPSPSSSDPYAQTSSPYTPQPEHTHINHAAASSAASQPPQFSIGTGAPSPAQPQPPQAKSKKAWWAAGACGCIFILVLLVAGVGLFFGGQLLSSMQGPEKTVSTYFSAAEAGDCTEARNALTEVNREDFNCQAFKHSSDIFFTQRSLTYKIKESNVQDDKASVVTRVTAEDRRGNSQTVNFTFSLKEEDGEWRIKSITSSLGYRIG